MYISPIIFSYISLSLKIKNAFIFIISSCRSLYFWHLTFLKNDLNIYYVYGIYIAVVTLTWIV
jgi:hypothetical protein